jgi:hypothetical protein
LELADLIAKQEIHEVLMRLMQGLDRKDWETVRSCFHPDGVHDHDRGDRDPDRDRSDETWRGSIEEFIELEKRAFERFVSNFHFVGNELIELDGDSARSEQYSVCWHRVRAEAGLPEIDRVVGMRCLDRLERREGEWRIRERIVIHDWQRQDPVAKQTA